MEKEIIVTDFERKIEELESKVLELEKANLNLQEYFSRAIDVNNSPFNGNPVFSSILKMSVDLEIHRIVWSHAGNHEYYCNDKKLFL
ncbi:MAG TPA: hypothetical protein VHO90_18295, partial [Bacteroidales bacterium]|nr:hypothetical protein [Bacteroidales bacterium]